MASQETDKVSPDVEQVKDTCPAFKEGCPYKKITERLFMDELHKCPAFKEGCPFKDAKTIKEVQEAMSKMPETKHHEGASHEELLKMLQGVHEVSKVMEKDIGECPAFKTEAGGCPFKSASQEHTPLVEPPSAVLSSADLAKLKELCPAFKEGCPFAKMDNKELLEQIKKCPEFKEGCAFKEAHTIEEIYHKLEQMPDTGEACHHRDVLLQTMKIIHGIGHDKAHECPILEKLGCPFKGVESHGKHLIEPVEDVLPDQSPASGVSAPEDLQAVDVTHLREKCPAFDRGCPFADIGEKRFTEKIKECPEFKDGCPFKDMETMAEVYEKLSKLPAFSGLDTHGSNLLDTLMQVHHVSKEMKEEMGECPVFSTDGCPFKTICSDGRPLMEKLEFNRWTEVFQTALQGELDSVARQVSEKEPSIQLSKELKKGTKAVHRAAENVHFVKEFARGRIESYWYRVLLADLYFVYRALEEGSRKNKDHPYFGAIHFPDELERVQSIEEDLAFYYGEDWEEQIQLTDATREYVERLEKLSQEDPSLLIPHHYTRYLGDLSGGAILKKMAVKAMKLPSTGEGVKFFTFDNVPNAKEFKNNYRSSLDKLDIDQETSDKLVEEANLAFMLNIKVFKEIDVLTGYGAAEEETVVTEEPKLPEGHVEPAGSDAKCPFATIAQKARKEQEKVENVPPIAEEPAPQTSKVKEQAVQEQSSPLANPVILALLIAAIAYVVGNFLFRN